MHMIKSLFNLLIIKPNRAYDSLLHKGSLGQTIRLLIFLTVVVPIAVLIANPATQMLVLCPIGLYRVSSFI